MKAKPRWYPVNITVGEPPGPVPLGTSGKGSVTVQDVPFILKRITHALLTLNGLFPPPPDPTAILGAIPDGLWTITLKTDTHVYMAEPIALTAAFGSAIGFDWLELPSPVEIAPKTTFSVELTTQVPRLFPVGLQIVLAGAEPAPEKG